MKGEPTANRIAILAATLLAALTTGALAAAPAMAAPSTLRDGLFGQRSSTEAPSVARYVSEDGASFTLDRSQGRPLLKFDGAYEVWALQPSPAPRGDVIYKNDLGEPMLRATRLGGVTLFTDSRPGGSAAALAGGGMPIRLSALGPQALLERLGQASARASRAAKRLIPFDAEATPASSALVADAALVASEALVRLARTGAGRKSLTQVERVRVVVGKKPSATLDDGVLRVTVAPTHGLAGRPSSEKVARAAKR